MKNWVAQAYQPDPVRVPSDDIGRFLGFFTPVPWLLYGLAVVQISYVPVVIIGLGHLSVWENATLLVLLATLSLIALPARTPLPKWRTWTILGVVISAVVIATFTQEFTEPVRPEFGWVLNPCDLLLILLIIRQRFLAGWIGLGSMQLVYVVWSIEHTGAPWLGLSLSHGQIGPMIAVTIFAIALNRSVRKISEHRSAERERADSEAHTEVEDRHIEASLQEVRTLAGPTLESIAAGGKPDKDEVRGLEAGLRDMIRGSNLAREPLVSELQRARERGMDIVVLDDTGVATLGMDRIAGLVEWAAGEVRAVRCGQNMTIRLTLENGIALVAVSLDGNRVGEMRTETGTGKTQKLGISNAEAKHEDGE